MKNISLFFLFFWLTHDVLSQPGTPDPAFGTGGVVVTGNAAKGNTRFEQAKNCFMQPDGKMLLVIDNGGRAVISRRLANGASDVSFAHSGFSDPVNVSNPTAAMQADGKIVIVGGAQNTLDFLVARFNPDGTRDVSFGNNGVTVTDAGTEGDFLNTVATGADGKIYAGGSINNNGVSEFALIRYTAAGQPDPTFGQNGILITNIDNLSFNVAAIAVLPNGKVIAHGQVPANDGGDYALAKYNVDGSPDVTFNGTGGVITNFGSYEIPVAITVSSDGKIYAGGYDYESGYQHFRVTRYSSDGSIDLTYNNGTGTQLISFGNTNDVLTNILLQGDGKLLLAGHAYLNSSTSYDIEVTRLNSDGTLDNGFGLGGLVTSDLNSSNDINSLLALAADGKIIAGGSNYVINGDFTMFRYSSVGVPDLSFGTGGSVLDFVPAGNYFYSAIYNQSDGKLLVSGAVSDGATEKFFLSRFNANGNQDNTFGQNGTMEVSTNIALFQPDGKAIGLAYPNSANGGDFSISRYNLDGSPDQGFGIGGTVISDFGGNEFVSSTVAVQPDGKIIVPGIQYADFGSHLLLARFNPNGTLDNSFGTSGLVNLAIQTESSIQSILVQPDGKILGCGYVYSYPPDFSYFHFDELLIRLNADGSLDNSFGESGILIKDRAQSDFAAEIALQADNKIVYTYGAGNGFIKYYAERLNPDGSTDNSFGQSGQVASDGSGLLIQADQKILVSGIVPNLSNFLQSSITRLNSDGSPDNSFGVNGKMLQSFSSGDNYVYPRLISGNSLFVTGYASSLSDSAVIAKLRLQTANAISCPVNQVVSTDKNSCSAKVNGIDPSFPAGASFKYKLTGATKGTGNGSASGKIFNKGVTTVTYTLNSDATKSCSFTVSVEDKELPVIGNLTVSDAVLWPADHKMKDITINYFSDDNCGVSNIQLSVSSNEVVQSNESGDLSPDWQVLDGHHIRLRAERLQSGSGRIYTIKVMVTDNSGNQNSKTVNVSVPKNVIACNLGISASPNPSHSSFLIKIVSSCSDKINIRLKDNSGNVLRAINNITAPQFLNIGDNLLPGVYYLEATQGSVTKSLKLIKQ